MPRRRVLIVDGYNVIRNNDRYALAEADYDGSAWNSSREALVNDAATYARGDYERCYVVFDGAGNEASTGEPTRRAGIDVIFSPAGVSADSVIEKLAFEAREDGCEAVVVSSDTTIQSTVFGGGVVRMSAGIFSSSSEALESEWRKSGHVSSVKNTLGERIDPETAARLEALLHRGE